MIPDNKKIANRNDEREDTNNPNARNNHKISNVWNGLETVGWVPMAWIHLIILEKIPW